VAGSEPDRFRAQAPTERSRVGDADGQHRPPVAMIDVVESHLADEAPVLDGPGAAMLEQPAVCGHRIGAGQRP
jgi:hypothetical protein